MTGTALALGLLASWWATGLRPFTLPAAAVTIGAGLVALAVGARGRRPASRPQLPGIRLWVLLALALGAWELVAFLQHPRLDHPTLSSLTDSLLQGHPARAVAFLAWLGVGADLARR